MLDNFFKKINIGAQVLFNPEFQQFIQEQRESEPVNKSYQYGGPSFNSGYSMERLNPQDYGIMDANKNESKKEIVSKKKTIISYEYMDFLYHNNSLIRACVDTKVKQIASLDWEIIPRDVPYLRIDNMSEKEKETRRNLEELLLYPNLFSESFDTLITKWLTDLLKFDAAVLNVIWDRKNNIPVGLKTLHGPDIKFIVNVDGEIIKYKDSSTNKEYKEDEIIYMELYPSTDSLYGNPPIESIVTEIASDIYSLGHNIRYFSENEVPDGMLYLGHLPKQEYEVAKQQFKQYKAQQYTLRLLAGPNEPKWINFRPSNKDMQFSELQDKVRKRIMTVYQINDSELGYTEELNSNSSEMQKKIFEHKGLRPLIKLVENHINNEFIKKINPKYYFRFQRPQELEQTEKYKQLMTQTDLMRVQLINLLYAEGKITLNEYRKIANTLETVVDVLKLPSVEFGDQHIVGGSYTTLETSIKVAQKGVNDPKTNLEEKLQNTNTKDIGIDDLNNLIKDVQGKSSKINNLNNMQNKREDNRNLIPRVRILQTKEDPNAINRKTTKVNNITPSDKIYDGD